MAATSSAKAQKPNWFKRFLNFWKKLGLKIGKAFKNTFYELKKVTWPTKKELINATLAVMCFVAAFTLIIWLMDLAVTPAFKWLVG